METLPVVGEFVTSMTAVDSFVGGLLIGLSAVLLMFFLGRIMGATGILSGMIVPASFSDFSWRAALIIGMISAPIIMLQIFGIPATIQIVSTTPMLIVGGLLVGVGVTFGSGCASGHGVCGMARLSKRSIAATLVFMAAAFATVYILRHVIGA